MLLLHLFALAAAQTETLSNVYGHRQICAGVYSAKDRPGPFNSEISVTFPTEDLTGNLTLAIFAYSDIDSLGVPVNRPDGRPGKHYICDEEAIGNSMCSKDDLGKIIIDRYSNAPKHDVYTNRISLPDSEGITYAINETGYYCVVSFPLGDTSEKYKANVHFMNAYGHVPGEEVALLWFHAAIFFVYVAFFIVWIIGFVRYRQDALAVQKWITGLAGYMVVEQVILWIYYHYFNAHGQESGVSKFLLVLVAIIGAGRLSLTLFCVLIVSMGYSVVHERLGPTMKYCKIMGVALFISSALYMIDSYYLVPSDESRLIEFLFFFPSAILVGIFYVWTLQSLGDTKLSLMSRKQHVKARMYRNLWLVLLGSAISIFAFFILHTFVTATQRVKDVVNTYWKTKWLLTSGWPNIVYLIAFILVAFIWRPTGDNRRFAMSTQLAQSEDDAEEFEIGSLDGSDVEPEEFEPTSGVHRDPTHQEAQTRSATTFDADQDTLHGREDDGEDAQSDQWNRNEDEDDLVSAPGGKVKPSK